MISNDSISMNGFFVKRLSFFGLLGGLPLSFTARVLQNDIYKDIDIFFDEFLFLLEEIKNETHHSCLMGFIRNKLRKENGIKVWKIIPINHNNRLNVNRIGSFIIGHQKRYITKVELNPIGRINYIKIVSKNLKLSL